MTQLGRDEEKTPILGLSNRRWKAEGPIPVVWYAYIGCVCVAECVEANNSPRSSGERPRKPPKDKED